MKTVDPFIVCLKMDRLSFERLSAWRKLYFPPERNFLDAHLTLYHRLPFPAHEIIRDALRNLTMRRESFVLTFEQIVHHQLFLGIKLATPEVVQLKKELDRDLTLWLAPQDRQTIVPHVTVSNNGQLEAVDRAKEELEKTFVPWQGRAEGLQLFRYRRGPWEWLEDFSFGADITKPD